MIYMIASALSGLAGGIFVSQFFNQYSLGMVGNIIAGLTGGLAAHALTLIIFGGNAFSVAIVFGFLAGVITRGAFSVLKDRMIK